MDDYRNDSTDLHALTDVALVENLDFVDQKIIRGTFSIPGIDLRVTKVNLKAKIYVGAVVACGLLAFVAGLRSAKSTDPALFLAILILAIAGSFMKVTIAGTQGSMSMNFIFIMLGITRLNLGETLFVGIVASLVQTFWHQKKRRKAITVLFNTAVISAVVAASWLIFHSRLMTLWFPSTIVRLCFISVIYFILNTGIVAGVISITNDQKLLATWRDTYAWSLPYSLLGTSAAGIFNVVERTAGMEMALLVLPIAFLAYRSYCMRLEAVEKSRLHAEHQHKHAEEVATLHLRTIRALALAIEAKDTTTGEHLHRVHTYALAIGRELQLSEDELQALSAASILHDIGKIAVPEYIISKPAKLSREEFEKMKIHPLVGGEIVESVKFPYPVAPIVSAHHEKWDGTGYPMGLKGEEIPVGARILSAVDCLDALASDRQYRRALPVDKAMEFVRSESGRAFDPRIVEILSQRYQELEFLARSTLRTDCLQLSLAVTIERGAAPDAGLEIGHLRDHRARVPGVNVLDKMADSFTEIQLVQGFDKLFASRKAVAELMAAFTRQLCKTVQFDSVALFLKNGTSLSPHFVDGVEAEVLRTLLINIGSGLSGWVAEHRIPLLNGNPASELAMDNALPPGFSLRSALAIPLESEKGLLGVLTLYSQESEMFHGGHLRLCMSLRSRLAFALEAAILSTSQRVAAGCHASGLPNTGALLKHLDGILVGPLDTTTLVLVIRIENGAVDALLDPIAAVVRGLGVAGSFLARASEEDYVMVLQPPTHSLLALELAFSDALTRAGHQHEFSVGSAEAPDDAMDADGLVSVAVSRLHPCAVSDAPKISASLSALGRATATEHDDAVADSGQAELAGVRWIAGGSRE